MAYAKINKTGCLEERGNLQIRIDFFLEEGDPRYNDPRFYIIDWSSSKAKKGYPGLVNDKDNPIDADDYKQWKDNLPHIWNHLKPFHVHFFYASPDITDAEIKKEMDFHLPNFYTAFQNEWDKVPCGMRHGFAVEKRQKIINYKKILSPEAYTTLKNSVLAKAISIPVIESTVENLVGREYPSTEIDVGQIVAAPNNASLLYDGATYYTDLSFSNISNDTGWIDTIQVVTVIAAAGNKLRVGFFFDNGDGTLTCTSKVALGVCAVGDQSFTGSSVTVVIGDTIGVDAFGASGNISIERQTSGYTKVGYTTGTYCDVSDVWSPDGYFTDDALSIYATGDTEPPASDIAKSALMAGKMIAGKMI